MSEEFHNFFACRGDLDLPENVDVPPCSRNPGYATANERLWSTISMVPEVNEFQGSILWPFAPLAD